MVFYMCNLVHENSVKVCEVRIFNKAICTAFWNGGSIRQFANTHVGDLCVGGVAVLLNDMAKLTLSDADLANGSYGVRQEKACGEHLSDNDLRTHALHWYVPPSLSCTHTLMSHDSPESSRRLARRTHRLSASRRHAHMCSSHPTLRTSKKQKTARTFYFGSHVTHLYYYSCGERSLGIVYCTLTKRSGARTH